MSQLLVEVDSAKSEMLDMELAKTCGETLLKHYPNQLWAVVVKSGVIQVRNLTLSGRWGFVLKQLDIFSATDLDNKLMLAGGEILERYRLSRAKMAPDVVADKALALSADFAGNLKFDA